MKIVIRMDDITPDMDRERFERFLSLLHKRGIGALLGVVPCSRDDNLHKMPEDASFWDRMKQLEQQGHTLAMHGCYHIYTTTKGGLFPLNRLSEFAGLPYEKQNELIREGKRLLAGKNIRPEIFMAPAHSYDRNTLKALKENGFTAVTDGFGKRPYRQYGLDFYPIAFNKNSAFKAASVGTDGCPGAAAGTDADSRLKNNKDHKGRNCREAITTLVVHVNTMNENDFAFYEKLFAQAQVVSYSEYMKLEKERRGAAGRLREWMAASLKRTLVTLAGIRK